MLTGRRLFAGDTVSDTLAAVLTRDPDWSKLPPTTPRPAPFARMVSSQERGTSPAGHRGRVADSPGARGMGREDQFSDIRGTPAATRSAGRMDYRRPRRGRRDVGRRHPFGSPEAAEELTYIDIAYPPAVEPLAWLGGRIAISPDGRTVGMIGVRSGVRRALIRQLDQADADQLPETSGANWLAFSLMVQAWRSCRAAALSTLSLRDQQRKSIASGGDIVGSATWVPAGVVFTRDRALWIVPAEGGKPRALTQLDVARNEVLHFDPSMLPGGRMVLFSMTKDPGTSRIEAVSVDSGKRAVIAERATTPAWSLMAISCSPVMRQ